jgi:L,D-transpeptidase YcfS
MGHHAIRLAAYGGVYLLHGTNADFGIGMRVSSGCIRLRDDDIKTLFNVVTPGTKVNIINTPIKVSEEPAACGWLRFISRYRKTLATIRRRCPLT